MLRLAPLPALVALALLAPGAEACYFGFLSWDVGAAVPEGGDAWGTRLFFEMYVQGSCNGPVQVTFRGGLEDTFAARMATAGLCGPRGFCQGWGWPWQGAAFHVEAPDRGFVLDGAMLDGRSFGHEAAYASAGTYLHYRLAVVHLLMTE